MANERFRHAHSRSVGGQWGQSASFDTGRAKETSLLSLPAKCLEFRGCVFPGVAW
jgi:hypothetical protein